MSAKAVSIRLVVFILAILALRGVLSIIHDGWSPAWLWWHR